ncbi:MAG: hypothetical protein U5K81_08670 [Trueperaceae bacterium]|nr:hypothetical protein [Trueperaceae bacterium]
MFTILFLSSVITGLMATGVMVAFLYLPAAWNGMYYDTLGAIGTVWTRTLDVRARLLGAVALGLGGIAFAMFYGAFALMFMQQAGGAFVAPAYAILPGLPTTVDLFYPLLGLVGGFGHGIFMSLIGGFIVTDFHPLARFRDPFPLIASFLIGHTVFGVVVMFFQHQLLQLLL